jgi:hypothetical protein
MPSVRPAWAVPGSTWIALTFGAAAACTVSLAVPGRQAALAAPQVVPVLVVAAVWVTAFGTAGRRSFAGRVAGAVVALGAAAVAGLRLADDLRGGLPTIPAVLLAVGATAGAVAAVGALLSRAASRPQSVAPDPSGTRPRVSAAGTFAAPAALLALAGLVVAAPPVVLARAVRSTTAEPVAVPPTAGIPGPSTWAWQPTALVENAVAAGAGAVLGLADGTVVALDGRTGRPRWHHARPGAHLDALSAAPDGFTVVAAYHAPTGPDVPDLLFVAFDALTGAIRWQRVPEWAAGVDVEGLHPTGRALPLRIRPKPGSADDFEWSALDLVTGEPLWRWRAPAGCTSPYALPASGRTVVLAPLRCPDGIGVAALDERTGRVRWTRTLPLLGSPESPGRFTIFLGATGDGRVASLDVSARTEGGLAPDPNRLLLDAESGAVLATPSVWIDVRKNAVPVVGDSSDPTTAVEAFDPQSRRFHRLDRSVCPGRSDVEVTRTAFLSICLGADRRTTDLAVQPFDGGPVVHRPMPATVLGDGRTQQSGPLLPVPGAVVVVPLGFYRTSPPVIGLVATG